MCCKTVDPACTDKVSRKAVITGATTIILGGKSIVHTGQSRDPTRFPFRGSELICGPGAILRGDLRRSTAGQHVVISMGRYCSVGEGAIIRPPGKIYKGFISLLNLWMLY